MSYEGFTKYICEKGHLREYNCYDEREFCDCGKRFIWSFDVDETNGYYEELDCFPEQIRAEEIVTCNLGHRHITKEALYKPPTNRGTQLKK